ncbi:hypothetical protein, partial [Mesorhizobium sp.]|uniref:hypothetical protein n=1 Tax=Mesorhizobium sp. TaxID=1871066 RepID=UPI00257E4C6C
IMQPPQAEPLLSHGLGVSNIRILHSCNNSPSVRLEVKGVVSLRDTHKVRRQSESLPGRAVRNPRRLIDLASPATVSVAIVLPSSPIISRTCRARMSFSRIEFSRMTGVEN